MATMMPYLASDGIKWTSTIHGDTYPAISSATGSNLGGKTVMITGAAKGVGRATAISFARVGASHIAVTDLVSFGELEEEIVDAAKSNGKPRPKIWFWKWTTGIEKLCRRPRGKSPKPSAASTSLSTTPAASSRTSRSWSQIPTATGRHGNSTSAESST